MDTKKQQQESSLIGRIFSLEALLVLMGFFSLGSGIIHSSAIQIFWGITILCGVILLILVRRRDWQKHWAEQDSQQPHVRDRKKEE